VDIANLQAYGYFGLVTFMVIALYAYIYYLYKVKKDSDGIDFEDYSNMALHDDIDDTPVLSKSDD
jgi:cytochrome c oxidase cbb3-type subunit 4